MLLLFGKLICKKRCLLSHLTYDGFNVAEYRTLNSIRQVTAGDHNANKGQFTSETFQTKKDENLLECILSFNLQVSKGYRCIGYIFAD